MRRLALASVVASMVLAFLSVSALADCESDCDGPFQTCLNLCRQTTKEDSPEGAKCVDRCFHGLAGCQKRCAGQKNSENIGDQKESCRLAFNAANREGTVFQGASCIDQGLTCVLNGTPCCAPYECKGKFPNTYCQ
jgi:hypothetical protein